MTKWKCEGCKKFFSEHPSAQLVCTAETNTNEPAAYPVVCLLGRGKHHDWYKVETVEEWLDLEDEPRTRLLPPYNLAFEGDKVICQYCGKVFDHDDGEWGFHRCPKAKPDTDRFFEPLEIRTPEVAKRFEQMVEDGEKYAKERYGAKPDNPLKGADDWDSIERWCGVYERIEKLEEVFKCEVQDSIAWKLVKMVEDVRNDVEELKKKAHEHHVCTHDWSKDEPIIHCTKCGRAMFELMYPRPMRE